MLLYKCLFQRINYLYKIEDTDGGDRRKIEDFGEVNFPISNISAPESCQIH